MVFADSNFRGFDLDKFDICHPHRMAHFQIAVFIAYIWMIYLGVLVFQTGYLGATIKQLTYLYLSNW